MLSKHKRAVFKMKKKWTEISVVFGLLFSIVFSIVSFGNECKNIRSDVLRLHILANSDSEEDQQVKLAVRDVLLNCGSNVFSGKINLEDARQCLDLEKEMLVTAANKVLAENGFDYKARIYFAEEFFLTRTYEKYTLPAGNYLALKVILGEGNGHNWWCVMFPPLCIPAASENTDLNFFFDKNETHIIQSNPKYEIRFKIIEILEEIMNKYI